MASIIPGYEYDIFISYRHKDNKHDGWVSEFVNQLKGELESTFKEAISVYFDINPHDGLLETYDVDATLKEKLKCLVFIPIISRTYCDPNSFAWEHEFKAFVEQASRDQFGLKVKLPNGNVANRILPIQIHEITFDDKAQIEKELGGILRPVEFIYKEPGVNKPLNAGDDEKLNLNKTKYRIQINKVANAIDEVIHSLKNVEKISEGRKLIYDKPLPGSNEEALIKDLAKTAIINQRNKKWMIIVLSVVICIIGVVTIYKLNERSKKADDIAKLEKSIAVLPFVNLSGEGEEYLSEGLTDQLITSLGHIEGFKVASQTSIVKYKASSLSLKEISRELGVNYILEGSVQKSDKKLRISVRLIRTSVNIQEWSDTFNRNFDDILAIQDEISLSVANALGRLLDLSKLKDDKPTNIDAYDHFLKGEFLWRKWDSKSIRQAIGEFKQAVRLDSVFALAYSKIGLGYAILTAPFGDTNAKSVADSANLYNNQALQLNPDLVEALITKGTIKWWFEKDPEGAEQLFRLGLKNQGKSNVSVVTLTNFGFFLCAQNRPQEGLQYCLEAYKIDPAYMASHLVLGDVYFILKEYTKAEFHYREGLSLFPGHLEFIQSLAWLYCSTNRYQDAKQILEENKNMFTTRDPRLWVFLAIAYAKLGDQQKSKSIIAEVEKTSDKEVIVYDLNYHLARFYSVTDQKNTMYRYLENSLTENENDLLWLKVDPLFQDCRNDSLFKNIMKRAGFK